MKVLKKDWKCMVASIKELFWVNMVGTYGVASAQLYWGRLAALLVRLTYHLSSEFLWVLVFVDDFVLLEKEEALAGVFLLFMEIGWDTCVASSRQKECCFAGLRCSCSSLNSRSVITSLMGRL